MITQVELVSVVLLMRCWRRSLGTLLRSTPGRKGLVAFPFPKLLQFQVLFTRWFRRERTCQMWLFSSGMDSKRTSATEDRAHDQHEHRIQGLTNPLTLQQSHPSFPPLFRLHISVQTLTWKHNRNTESINHSCWPGE